MYSKGKKSGPPPKKGPQSQGLNIKYNTVKTVKLTEKINGYSGYKEQELTLTKSQPDESTGAVSSDYDEYTVRADTDGKMKDIDEGLEDIDDLIEELGPENISAKELEDMGYDVNRLGPTIKKKLGIK